MKEFYRKESRIARGELVGLPVHTRGAQIRCLGLPVLPNGQPALTGDLGFEGSFDGTRWFTLNTFEGNRFTLTPRALQQVIPANGLKPASAILPVQGSALFEGCQMIRPVISAALAVDVVIEFYQELSEL